jgi:hypothetical protein
VTETVTIELPLPARELHQNARVHFMRLANAKRAARYEGLLSGKSAQNGKRFEWGKATVDMMFYFPDRRRRDAFNYAAAMKYAIDGIVEAGLLVDDSWENLIPGRIERSPELDKHGRVLLHFTRLDGANDDE